jgi:hypothetical protein
MQIIKFNSFITLILVLFLFFTQANGENKKISNGKHEINLYGGVFDFSDVWRRLRCVFDVWQCMCESVRVHGTVFDCGCCVMGWRTCVEL